MSDLMSNGAEPEDIEEEQEEQEVGEQFAHLLTLDNNMLIMQVMNIVIPNDEAAAALAIVQNRIRESLPAARKALKDAQTAYPKNDEITKARSEFDAKATALPEYAVLKGLLEEREDVMSDLSKAVLIETSTRSMLDTILPNVRKQRGDDNFGNFIRARRTAKSEVVKK